MSRPTRVRRCLTPTGLSPAMADLSRSFGFMSRRRWPGPGSLATTTGVSVDVLSSRYLDVSVPWVCLKPPILFGSLIPSLDNRKSKTSCEVLVPIISGQPQNLRSWSSGYRRWVAPFGNPWIKASSQLPTAYRSVARPSSPLSAKASTEHP